MLRNPQQDSNTDIVKQIMIIDSNMNSDKLMDENILNEILKLVASGELSPKQATQRLRMQSDELYDDIDFARIDTDRALRTGHGEVVFCIGKTPEQTAAILKRMAERDDRALPIVATKAGQQHYDKVMSELNSDFLKPLGLNLKYFDSAGLIVINGNADVLPADARTIAVISAGTADIPIAEEAAVIAELYGHNVKRIYDVGVAGLHRVLDKVDEIRACSVAIVVAGMEGALASVVAGLVNIPVIAVPTSVGYGVTLDGLTPLFAMLSGCSLGVGVMNIDNGFGAGHLASVILESANKTMEAGS